MSRAPSRREVLASIAALGAVGAMLPAAQAAGHPDAELLAACAEVIALEARIEALWREHAGDEDARDAAAAPLEAAEEEPLSRVCELRATTLAGHQARARALLAWDKDPPEPDAPYWNDAIMGALLRDLGGEVSA